MKKFSKITQKQISERGVQALSDRPNVVQQYGQSGLSATQLKLWFDKLATFLAERINLIQDAFSGSDAASYLRLELKGLDPEKEKQKDFLYSLQDLCDSFKDGNFAKYLLALSSESDYEKKSVQTILFDTAKKIEDVNTALKTYQELLKSKDGAANIGLPEKYNGADKTLADLINDLFNGTMAAKIVLSAYGFSSSDKATLSQKSLQAYLNDVKDALQAGKESVLLEKINERYTKTEADRKLKAGLDTKVNTADVMESFSGEDINNKQKVLSAYAFNAVYSKINLDILNADTKAKNAIKSVTYDPVTGVITFTDGNSKPVSFDLPSEKILKNGASYYDDASRTLHLVLMDDSDIEIDVSHLVDEYYGDDETIELTQEEKRNVFRIKPNFKKLLDGYGEEIKEHAKELEKKVAIDDIVDGFGSEDSEKPVSARAASELNRKVSEMASTLTRAYAGADYDRETGTLRLHKTDGTDDSVSFPLESFVSDATFDPLTNVVTLTVANGKNVSFDLSALIDYYYGDGETIEVYDDPDDGFKHKVRVKANFLNGVKTDIEALNTRLTQAEKEIKTLSSVEKFGSIGRADGTTITMDEETGDLTAHKLQLSDGIILDFVQITIEGYLALEQKADNTLYMVTDGVGFMLVLHEKVLYAGGVKDSESGEEITFRKITRAAYDGLEKKEKTKLYLIDEGGRLSLAHGDLEFDLAAVATSGEYTDLKGAPAVPSWALEATKPAYTKSEVGLENVQNVDTTNAANITSGKLSVERLNTNTANGVLKLDEQGKVPTAQLPSYVDDVEEYENMTLFPKPGESGKIYLDTTANLTYRWSGTEYVEISPSLALGETTSTAYAGNKGKENADAIAALQARVTDVEKTANSALQEIPAASQTVRGGVKVYIDSEGYLCIDT